MLFTNKNIFIKALCSAISLLSFNLLAQPSSLVIDIEVEHLLKRYKSLLKTQSRKMEEDTACKTYWGLLQVASYMKQLKPLYAINNCSKGIINIEASALSAGAYFYTLIVTGKTIGTKRMVGVR